MEKWALFFPQAWLYTTLIAMLWRQAEAGQSLCVQGQWALKRTT